MPNIFANIRNMLNMSRKYQKISPKHVEESWKRRPNITTHIWLGKIKCSSKSARFGLKPLTMVSLWPEKSSHPKFLDEPKNQQNEC